MSKYVGLKIGKVHEEHIESEYYCGGCGWPVTDHDSYCPECGGAFQKSFADDALEAENAKLRELVRSMWLYDYAGKFSTARNDVEHVAMVYQRIRELGIEVNE